MIQREPWSDSALSALFDEELGVAEHEIAQRASPFDEASLVRWAAYQNVRDGLLHGQVSDTEHFVERFRASLLTDSPASSLIETQQPAANDAVVRWKWVAGFSSCVAAGALAWANWGSSAEVFMQAQSTERAPALSFAAPYPKLPAKSFGFTESVLNQEAESAGGMMRDPDLDELLRAHGAVSSAHAASFFRSAMFNHEGL